MLTTYLHGFISKFVLIEDDLEEPGDKLFSNIIDSALATQINIVYCQFSINLVRKFRNHQSENLKHVNFTQLSLEDSKEQLKNIVLASTEFVVIIDSLSHMIYKFGAKETYKTLGNFVKMTEVKQIISLLHNDLLDDSNEVLEYFTSLASLHIRMERRFGEARRLSYLYRRGRGKVVRDIEEFCFTRGKLITRPLAKIDTQTLLQEGPSINSLTTFNIELNERDMISRSQMDLPFLPKDLKVGSDDTSNKQGEIHYVFDAGDDWDAEDPDDDLDI